MSLFKRLLKKEKDAVRKQPFLFFGFLLMFVTYFFQEQIFLKYIIQGASMICLIIGAYKVWSKS